MWDQQPRPADIYFEGQRAALAGRVAFPVLRGLVGMRPLWIGYYYTASLYQTESFIFSSLKRVTELNLELKSYLSV